jgi:hypothetical protein
MDDFIIIIMIIIIITKGEKKQEQRDLATRILPVVQLLRMNNIISNGIFLSGIAHYI